MAEGTVIEKIDFNQERLDNEYYNCVFESCDFSDKSVTDVSFEDCVFKRCNFALAKFFCYFSSAEFVECKMTGADFTGISKFSSSFCFEKSQMNYVSFYKLKIRKSRFAGCNLNEAYFDETDLASSIFDDCDLMRTSFHGTNLEKVDFFTSHHFSIDPTANRLKKTVFSASELRGLVSHLDIVIKDV